MNTLHHLKVEKTTRYALIGDASKKIKQVWIVCHGYGHLASYFVKKFEALNDGETLIIAPEGLHRFYLNGTSGRVGASWMTKEDRLNDIEDYIAYLDRLYETLVLHLPVAPETITCLGFSQGGATASRWVAATTHRIDHLVMWASVFPPDMNSEADLDRLRTKNTVIAIGNQDEYVSAEQKQLYLQQLTNNRIGYKLFEFEGAHEIHASTLLEIKKYISATGKPH